MKNTKQMPEVSLDTIREEVRRCYAASNEFTDETREQLLAGAQALESTNANVLCRPRH